jgi:hypothetical protein
LTAAAPGPAPSPHGYGPSRAAALHRWRLSAAGFATASGAHGIAANLGACTRGGNLLVPRVLLARCDGAEVELKPVFGALAGRAGGPAGFAAASAGPSRPTPRPRGQALKPGMRRPVHPAPDHHLRYCRSSRRHLQRLLQPR